MAVFSVVTDRIRSCYAVSAQTETFNLPLPSPPTPPRIKFDFSCRARFNDWIPSQDSTELLLVAMAEVPAMKTFIDVDFSQLSCYEKAQEIIGEELKYWHIYGEAAQERLIKLIVDKAREAVVSMPASHNHVCLHIRVAAVHNYVFEEWGDFIDWVVQQSMDEDEVGMIPADNSSIEALESRKILNLDDSSTCSVCLDEFFRGCEAVCMPCAHVFHEGCIKKWLRVSHYCPVCRYEMPMSKTDSSSV